MTEADNTEKDPAESYPPLNPDPVGQREPSEQGSRSGNIRDQQQTHAGGAVPPAYVGSGDPEAGPRPEDPVDDTGKWDEQGRGGPGV